MSTLESHESYGEDELKKELDSLWKSVKPEEQGNIENTGDHIKNYVQSIIEESVAFDSLSLPLNLPYIKESMVNYIVDWKLNSNENGELEAQIKKLSENLMNWKIKYLIDNSYKPLINIIQDIKDMDKERKDNLKHILDKENPWDEKSFYWIKLERQKVYTVEWVSNVPKWRASSWAFKNCRLTKRLWKVWFDTTIIEHNWTRINRANYHEETYYSQKVLPWKWLKIPWRHVAEDGTIRDEDWYIVVAADLNYAPRDSIVMTTLWPGKVYDTWSLPRWRFDIYVDW